MGPQAPVGTQAELDGERRMCWESDLDIGSDDVAPSEGIKGLVAKIQSWVSG